MKNLGQNKNSAFSPLSRLTPESAMVQLSTSFAYVTSHEDHDLFRLLHQSEYAGTLGHPPANTPKFFSTELLAELRDNQKWLEKATDAISTYWRRKNGQKRIGRSLGTGPRRLKKYN
jgi:hypothetical protein